MEEFKVDLCLPTTMFKSNMSHMEDMEEFYVTSVCCHHSFWGLFWRFEFSLLDLRLLVGVVVGSAW